MRPLQYVFYTDGDMAALFRVSQSTIRRWVRTGPWEPGMPDIRRIEPMVIGATRRWPALRVIECLKDFGIFTTAEEIAAAIDRHAADGAGRRREKPSRRRAKGPVNA